MRNAGQRSINFSRLSTAPARDQRVRAIRENHSERTVGGQACPTCPDGLRWLDSSLRWNLARPSRPRTQKEMKRFCWILIVVLQLCCSSYAAPRVISVGLFVQSAFGANTIYNLFSNNLHALRNVVIRNRVPYEQGIYVFAQPVMSSVGNLAGYSLAVTGTTSLSFSNGVPDNGDTRELYRSTTQLYVTSNQLPSAVAEIVHQLARKQFQTGN